MFWFRVQNNYWYELWAGGHKQIARVFNLAKLGQANDRRLRSQRTSLLNRLTLHSSAASSFETSNYWSNRLSTGSFISTIEFFCRLFIFQNTIDLSTKNIFKSKFWIFVLIIKLHILDTQYYKTTLKPNQNNHSDNSCSSKSHMSPDRAPIVKPTLWKRNRIRE